MSSLECSKSDFVEQLTCVHNFSKGDGLIFADMSENASFLVVRCFECLLFKALESLIPFSFMFSA